jgi:kinesin family protein C1
VGRYQGRDEQVRSVIKDAKGTPAYFARSCSPAKQPQFLTKDTSSVTNFSGWDIDERLHGIESQFRVMKETMDGTLTDRKALEEAVDIAKTRGSLPVPRYLCRHKGDTGTKPLLTL